MSSTKPDKLRLVLVNPNTSKHITDAMVEIAASTAGASASLSGVTAPFGAPLISDPKALACAADAVAAIPHEAFADADGVIVAAFGDPGVDTLRDRLDMPVVGIAEAAMRKAATLGRFAIVTTTPALRDEIIDRATLLGLREELVAVRTTSGDPSALLSRSAALAAELAKLVQASVDEDRVASVIIGGGPLAVAARQLAETCPIPLIEPVPEAVSHLMACLAHPLGR